MRLRAAPAPLLPRLGFTREDLAVFGMADAHARGERAHARLEPLLWSVAGPLAPALSQLAGRTLSAVADAEAPPSAVAVRFCAPGADAAAPHLVLAMNRAGVHARLRVPEAAPDREAMARRLARCAAALARELSGCDLRRYDGAEGAGLPAPGSPEDARYWREAAAELGRAGGTLDVGVGWPEARAVLLCRADLVPAYRPLVALWRRLEG